MSTLTKAKKTAPKVVRRARVAKPAARAVRLVPPPGMKAAKVADLLPPPSKDFDADFVAKVVALRS